MNGKTARALRKKAYGEYSQRTPSYDIIERAVRKLFTDRKGVQKYHDVIMGQRVCDGLRAKYLQLKKRKGL